MRLEIERIEEGIAVHYADAGLALASRGREILIARDTAFRWRTHVELPRDGMLGRFENPLLDRLLRRGVHLIKHVESDTFICFHDQGVYRFNTHASKVRWLWTLPRGRRILRNGACLVGTDLVVGDYWRNRERVDVRVHRLDVTNGSASSFLTFPAGRVRHVHLVQRDPFDGKVWIGTGDEDDQCLLLRLDPADPKLQSVGGGSQKWRTVTLLFTQDAVYWGSDNHTGSNALYRYDRGSGSLEMVGPVIGPVYYAISHGRYRIFGTTVEKSGGEQGGTGRLYAIDETGDLVELYSDEGDGLMGIVLGYATFEFADGPGDGDSFWVTLRGFKGGLRSMRCRVVR